MDIVKGSAQARRFVKSEAPGSGVSGELREVLDTMPCSVWTASPEGQVDFVNERWCEYTGLGLAESCARWPETIYPEDLPALVEEWQRVVAAGESGKVEARVRRFDGLYRRFVGTARPLRDAGGRIVQWYGVIVDVEDETRGQAALKRSEAFLADAQRLTRTGSFRWQPSTNELTWSKELYRIYELDEVDALSMERALSLIHPDDLQTCMEEVERSRRGETVGADFVVRLRFPSGSVKHVQIVVRSTEDESGNVEYTGAVQDVTAATESRRALEQAYGEIKALRDQLQNENVVLREEIDKVSMFEEIVGSSPPLIAALSRVEKVAGTDSTVLITGETGTGKELIARAIHKRSPRAARAFVGVNCASIPTSLIASELFGHEKGAFTGALAKRVGRFELAQGGTIFLDEVGELPPETQVALLRVLQEHEFEPVGAARPIKADVRVVCATNRDLPAAIEAGAVRSDLFYRLNVFPINMPSLRERREDIPALVEYFIDRIGRSYGKRIRRISKKSLQMLQSYPWPGNVRELQNVIERSVIVCDTDEFSIDESWLPQAPVEPAAEAAAVLTQRSDAEVRRMIEVALAESQGRVSGPSGAASKLGIPATTLDSKIRALRIDKHRFKSI
jgi:PAS domain S-box-containing protein